MASSIQAQNSSIVKLQVQMDALQTSLSGMPDLNRRVTTMEAQLVEEDRRMTVLESFRTDRAAPAEQRLKGFVR